MAFRTSVAFSPVDGGAEPPARGCRNQRVANTKSTTTITKLDMKALRHDFLGVPAVWIGSVGSCLVLSSADAEIEVDLRRRVMEVLCPKFEDMLYRPTEVDGTEIGLSFLS